MRHVLRVCSSFPLSLLCVCYIVCRCGVCEYHRDVDIRASIHVSTDIFLHTGSHVSVMGMFIHVRDLVSCRDATTILTSEQFSEQIQQHVQRLKAELKVINHKIIQNELYRNHPNIKISEHDDM